MTYFFVTSIFAVVEVVEAALVDEGAGSVLVVVGMVLVVLEVVKAELVDEVVGSMLVVVAMVLVVLEVVKTELVAIELVETALVVVAPATGTVYVIWLEKPLSLL